MRSAIILSLVVLILAVGGGYSIMWYSQARTVKGNIEQSIAKINATQKIITYDAIETSGFPTNLYVAIVKPHFKGRIDPFIKAMGEHNEASPAATAIPNPYASVPEWNEDDMLDGRIVIGINALSNFFSLNIKGNIQETSKIGDATITTLHQQTDGSNCILKLKQSAGMLHSLWNFGALKNDSAADFIKNFSSLDCNHGGNSTIDTATKDQLSSSGPFRLYITNNGQQNVTQIRFYTKLADMQVTPKGDAMMANYFRAFSPQYPFPINYSVYGKQNIEVDFTYDGPVNFHDGSTNFPLHVDLSKFDLTSNIFTHHFNLLLDNNSSEGIRTAKLLLKSESAFGEEYDTLFQNIIRGLVYQARENKDPRFQEFQPAIQQYTPEQLYSIIYPALFSFHAMGTLVEAVDVNYKGSTDMANGDITLNDFELSSSLYGFKATGSSKIAQKLPQNSNINLDCKNCFTMIDDIIAYSGRLQKVVNYFSPEKAAAMTIDPKMPDDIKKFLAVLAPRNKGTNDDDKTLHFTFVSDSSGMHLNGRSLGEVMSIASEYLKPYSKQPPAAKK